MASPWCSMSHLALLSSSLAGSGMVHRAAESRTVRPTRRRWLRRRAGDAPHHTPCRFGPETERSLPAQPVAEPAPAIEEAERDTVNCESVPGKTGSLSVSYYSSHSMMAIHYVPLSPRWTIHPVGMFLLPVRRRTLLLSSTRRNRFPTWDLRPYVNAIQDCPLRPPPPSRHGRTSRIYHDCPLFWHCSMRPLCVHW